MSKKKTADILDELDDSPKVKAPKDNLGADSETPTVVEPDEKELAEREVAEEPKESPVQERTARSTEFPAAGAQTDVGIKYEKTNLDIYRHLQKQTKVSFFIPFEEGVKPQKQQAHPVQINGLRMWVNRGVMVVIPEQVAGILAERFQVEQSAGSHMLLDRDDEVRNALL